MIRPDEQDPILATYYGTDSQTSSTGQQPVYNAPEPVYSEPSAPVIPTSSPIYAPTYAPVFAPNEPSTEPVRMADTLCDGSLLCQTFSTGTEPGTSYTPPITLPNSSVQRTDEAAPVVMTAAATASTPAPVPASKSSGTSWLLLLGLGVGLWALTGNKKKQGLNGVDNPPLAGPARSKRPKAKRVESLTI